MVWLKPEFFPDSGRGSQIFFRGDDRLGLDPYTLTLHAGGNLVWSIQGEGNQYCSVSALIPVDKWTRVIANYNPATEQTKLFVDGKLAGFSASSVKPLARLDPGSSPGIGIGNVQLSKIHNQPFHGTICDFRLFDRPIDEEN